MLSKKLALTHEQSSPLFRIMWVYNANEVNRRQFENNISAFHIGNGYILSVAHNLRTESSIVKMFPENIYQNDILPRLNQAQEQLFNQYYILDLKTGKRYINIHQQEDAQIVADTLKSIQFDSRWITLNEKNICKPYLIVQFNNNRFCNDDNLTGQFSAHNYFHEPGLNRHTFLLELELADTFYSEDIALYKIINTQADLIHRLPHVEVDFSILDDTQSNFYCLQSSPGGVLGRLLNKAQIEGFLDHHGTFADSYGGNITFEGLRYLIQGYFRFGSSGAPYVFYDDTTGRFKVNAIQSEACPIQLSINNNREGNFQYVNALASPLHIIEDKLRMHINIPIL